MSCVLPGVPDVFARLVLLQIKFISDDLPTLLRPINANSGLSGFGQLSTEGLLITYSADLISIFIRLQYTLSEIGSEFRCVLNDILLPKGCGTEASTPVKHFDKLSVTASAKLCAGVLCKARTNVEICN